MDIGVVVNGVAAEVLIGALTFVLSLVGAVFVSGMRYGSMKTDIKYIRRDIDVMMKMFELTIRTAPTAKEKA